jgi:hypothetical protein
MTGVAQRHEQPPVVEAAQVLLAMDLVMHFRGDTEAAIVAVGLIHKHDVTELSPLRLPIEPMMRCGVHGASMLDGVSRTTPTAAGRVRASSNRARARETGRAHAPGSWVPARSVRRSAASRANAC